MEKGKEKGEENIRLIRIRKRAQQARRTPIIHQRHARLQRLLLERLHLRPVHANHEHPRDKRPEYLREDIMRHLPPRKALPHRKTDGHRRVEMPPARRRTRDDRKGDAYPERPSDLEEGSESCEPEIVLGDERVAGVEREAGYGCDAGEDVEEYACGFGHAFAQDAWAAALEVEFALRDGLLGDDVAGEVLLDGFRGAQLEVVGLEAGELLVGRHVGRYCHDVVDIGASFLAMSGRVL